MKLKNRLRYEQQQAQKRLEDVTQHHKKIMILKHGAADDLNHQDSLLNQFDSLDRQM